MNKTNIKQITIYLQILTTLTISFAYFWIILSDKNVFFNLLLLPTITSAITLVYVNYRFGEMVGEEE